MTASAAHTFPERIRHLKPVTEYVETIFTGAFESDNDSTRTKATIRANRVPAAPMDFQDAPNNVGLTDPVPSSPIREKPLRDVLAGSIRIADAALEASRRASSETAGVCVAPSILSAVCRADEQPRAFATPQIGKPRAVVAGVTVVVPCFNEEGCVAETARQLRNAFRAGNRPFEILFIDDGSTDQTGPVLDTIADGRVIRVLHHRRKRGYGFSLKDGIEHATHDLIAIIDADGTYPVSRLSELIDAMESADMVVGARTGEVVHVPPLRRPAKWFLRRLACHLANEDIPDLNSGMRVMRRDVVRRFQNILPDGFSFTTTITLAMLTQGYEVRYIPIDYARRIGRSSIRPVRDTLNFLTLIVRTALCFKPLRVFAPASAGVLFMAVAIAILSKLLFGQLADVTAVTLAVTALHLLGIGLIADLIDRRLPYANR